MSADVIRAGLNVMRRLPPASIRENLTALTALGSPEAADAWLQRVDAPALTRVCAATGRRYILCDYNRDGDSYRSPWSNAYDPPLADGFVPSPTLRALELAANELFDVYREQYYPAATSVSSVYVWELAAGFAACFLVKNAIPSGRFLTSGSWDAIHVLEVTPTPADARRTSYKLTTSVLVHMHVNEGAAREGVAASKDGAGAVSLGGGLTRQAMVEAATPGELAAHLPVMGGMIESMEGDMRSAMDALYIAKTREIVNALRARGAAASMASRAFVSDLSSAVTRRGGK